MGTMKIWMAMLLIVGIAFAADPSVGTVTVIPGAGSAFYDTNLNCSATCTDDDNATILGNFTWYEESSPVVTYDASVSCENATICYTTLAVTEIKDVASNWTCQATCDDGGAAPSAANSTARLIANHPPTQSVGSITPSTAYYDDTLNCSTTCKDNESLSLTARFTWWNGTNAVTDYDAAVTCANNTICYTTEAVTVLKAVGSSWKCESYCEDPNGGVDSAVNTSAKVISNYDPVINSIALNPTVVYSCDTGCKVNCSDRESADSEVQYFWYLNDPTGEGTAISSNTYNCTNNTICTETIAYAGCVAGDNLTCITVCTDDDAATDNTTANPQTVTILSQVGGGSGGSGGGAITTPIPGQSPVVHTSFEGTSASGNGFSLGNDQTTYIIGGIIGALIIDAMFLKGKYLKMIRKMVGM